MQISMPGDQISDTQWSIVQLEVDTLAPFSFAHLKQMYDMTLARELDLKAGDALEAAKAKKNVENTLSCTQSTVLKFSSS